MLKNPCAGIAEWKRTDKLASTGRDTNSSTVIQVTSPAECLNRFKKYLAKVEKCVHAEISTSMNYIILNSADNVTHLSSFWELADEAPSPFAFPATVKCC